jgi:DNA mismatch repair protein MutL
MTIRRLPDTVVNRIAAGEVIERPASVVKELMENAIDAGAGRIEIAVHDGGQARIAVVDDGAGIPGPELDLAMERHATSKLARDDLVHVDTLGFRGEALPSIGAIARVTITSRCRGSDQAWAIAVDGGRKGDVTLAAHPLGTRVDVRDLFFATPARLKFLKTKATELARTVDVVNRLAMAYPAVAITLTDETRTVVQLQAEREASPAARLARIGRIMGREFADNALPIDAVRDDVRLTGYAGVPTLNRRTASHQFLFVNGRPVRDKLLFAGVRVAYQDVVASDRHPMVVLFLELQPTQLDMNVHPMKTEVRFRDAARVRGLIIGALRDALGGAGHRVADTHADRFVQAALSATGRRGPFGASFPAQFSSRLAPGLAEASAAYQAPLPLGAAAPGAMMPGGPEPAPFAEPLETGALDDFPLGHARVQVHDTYIVAETADGLVIVDQHAAHERVMHERLKAAFEAGDVARQGLLIPEVVEMEPAAVSRLMARATDLVRLGLVFEPFGDGAVVVREVPALLGLTDIRRLVRDLADDLGDVDEALALNDRLNAVCASIACHGSIRAGRRLNVKEMNALLREIETTPKSGQCSHGRPTHVVLRRTDIERLFGRR